MGTFDLLFAKLPNGFSISSDGRESVEDEARAGRPQTSVTHISVERAEAFIVEDPTKTLRFVALELGVSYGGALAIVHEQLGRSKRCARWVSHQVDNITERPNGGNLPQLVARI